MQPEPNKDRYQKRKEHKSLTALPQPVAQSQPRTEVIFEEYQGYKRRRAVHVIIVSIILVLVFIQICFSVRLYRKIEKPLIQAVQKFLSINDAPAAWLEYISVVDSEHVNVAVLMAILTFMYGYDYMIGMGIMCKYLLGMIAFKFVSVTMKDPRPFWIDSLEPTKYLNEVVGYTCDATFAMPDLAIIQLFWFAINFRDIIHKSQIKMYMVIDKIFIWGALLAMMAIFVVKYISGVLFIAQAVMSLLLGFILLLASKYMTSYLKKAIERCTVGASLERKYIIRYYVLLMLIAILDIILLMTNDTYDHGQLKYVENLVIGI